MEKLLLSAVSVILGYIIIQLIARRVHRKAKKKITNEQEYRDYCKRAGFVYIPTKHIKETTLGVGFKYILPSQELRTATPYINIGFIRWSLGTLESLRALSGMDKFKELTFFQTYGGSSESFNGFAYPPLTKETIKSFQRMTDDAELYAWLLRQTPYVIDGVSQKPIDVETIDNISIPIANFGLKVIESLPTSNIRKLLFGQGDIRLYDLKSSLDRFPNVEKLYLNYVTIEGDQEEILDFFVNYCNTSKVEIINLLIYQDFNVDELKARLTRQVEISYDYAN